MNTIHNTYLDLSKLTSEEQQNVIAMLPGLTHLQYWNSYMIYPDIGYVYLHFSDNNWFVDSVVLNKFLNKSEVTLSEFKELFTSSRQPKTADQLADEIIKIMHDADLTPDQMLEVLKLTKSKLFSTT